MKAKFKTFRAVLISYQQPTTKRKQLNNQQYIFKTKHQFLENKTMQQNINKLNKANTNNI